MTTATLLRVIRYLVGPRASRRRIGRALSAIPAKSRPPAESGARRLRVTAVQMELRLEKSIERYIEHVHSLLRKAHSCDAELVVFPEDTPMGLIGLIPGVERLVGAPERPRAGHVDGPTAHLDIGALAVADIFRALTPFFYRVYLETFRALASSYGLYILGGSGMFSLREEKVTNTAHLFGPDGLIAVQDKLHFLPMEREWGLSEGDHLLTVDLPKARIAFPVCMDATYFETFRIAAAKEAELILIPTANPEPFSFWRNLRGMRSRIDENAMYGVHSCMVGSLLGLPLEGRSAVLAPYDLTPAGDGVLTEATDASSEQTVTTTLDLDLLAAYRRSFEARTEPNRALYSRYYGELYGGEFF